METVCTTYGTAGVYIKIGSVDESAIVGTYCVSILRCYNVCEILVSDRRQSNGPHYWEGFTFIVGKCLEHPYARSFQSLSVIKAKYDAQLATQAAAMRAIEARPQ